MAQSRLDFEVHGKVQGVFFRKCCAEKAQSLGISGYVMNTAHRTVAGHAQGAEESMALFKQWLAHTGSPSSRIDKAVFSNEERGLKGEEEKGGKFEIRR
jgi:acylphosphatase